MCMINDSHIRYRSSSSKQTMNNTNLPLLLLLPFVFIAVFSFVLFSIYVCFVFFFCAGAMGKVSVIRCCLTNSLLCERRIFLPFFFSNAFRIFSEAAALFAQNAQTSMINEGSSIMRKQSLLTLLQQIFRIWTMIR